METETEPVEPVEPVTTVDLPEPPAPADGDDTDVDKPANDNATPEQRASRKERRADRYREQRDRADAADRRASLAEAERSRMAEQIAELRGRTEQIQRQQTQAQGDPYEKAVTDLETKAQRHLAAAANSKDAATAQQEMNEYHRANRQAAVLEARRGFQEDLRRYSQSQPDPAQAGMKVALESEYPWLGGNEQARNAADAYIALLISRDKRPNNLATYREACALAAKDFGLGGTAERASDARRAAYNGVPARNGAGGDDGKTSLQMSTDDHGKMKIMARQLYPSLEPEDAYRKWLKEVGPALARK